MVLRSPSEAFDFASEMQLLIMLPGMGRPRAQQIRMLAFAAVPELGL